MIELVGVIQKEGGLSIKRVQITPVVRTERQVAAQPDVVLQNLLATAARLPYSPPTGCNKLGRGICRLSCEI